jgi:hypothetical protein
MSEYLAEATPAFLPYICCLLKTIGQPGVVTHLGD